MRVKAWRGLLLRILVGVLVLTGFLYTQETRSEKDPVRFGVLVSLDTVWGQMNLEGIQLAVDQVNRQGGIKGRHIELVVRDDHGSPARAVKHADELAQRKDILLIFGSSRSEVTLPIVPVTERYKKILISPFIGHHEVTQGIRFLFRPIFTTIDQGKAMARFLQNRLHKKKALLF